MTTLLYLTVLPLLVIPRMATRLRKSLVILAGLWAAIGLSFGVAL